MVFIQSLSSLFSMQYAVMDRAGAEACTEGIDCITSGQVPKSTVSNL
jgi:hypothetical protein